MEKKNYEEMSKLILDLVGGKDNITYFTHCVTRLRFNVRDKSRVDVKAINDLSGVMGSQWSGEQLQIIVGQEVNDLYKTICSVSGLTVRASIDENLDTNLTKEKFTFKRIFALLAEIINESISPFIPVLIGAGMIKVILLLLSTFNLIDVAGTTYQILSIVGDAGFYFLPVFIGKGAAKKFGADEGLGMLMALMLVAPSFVALVDSGTQITFLGIPVYAGYYSYLVFPVILCVAVMAPIQKFFRRISPRLLRSIIEPTCTILVMVPLAFCVLGPLGSYVGTYIANFLIWLYESTGFLGIAILGALYPFLVITGMHNGTTPYWLESFNTLGKEALVSPVDCLNNLDQGVAALAVALKTKNANLKSTGFTAALTAIVGGISEPAMYGVNLKNKTPLICVCIGNFCGAMFCGLMDVACYSIYGTGGLFAVPCYMNPGTNNLLYYVIAMVIAAGVTFVSTFILYKDKD